MSLIKMTKIKVNSGL